MNNLQVILRVRPLLHFEDEPAWHVRGKHVACLQTQAVREKVNRFVCSRQKQVEQIMAEYDYEF